MSISIHDDLITLARQQYERPTPNAPYDIVIAGTLPPKDVNLYQASRAATYIGLSANPVIKHGGVIIVPATMPEGAGQGIGEQNFYKILQQFGATKHLIEHLGNAESRAGEQRAYMLAQMLQQVHCIFVGAQSPDLLETVGLLHTATLDEALLQAQTLLNINSPTVLIVPDAIKQLPQP